MAKLSKRLIENAEVRLSEYMIWDSDIAGFGVRVLPSGRRSYLIQYRVGTRSRRVTLGAHGILTPDQARTLAIRELAAVRAGGDPAEDRKQRRAAITVRELSERFDREHISVRVKESTAKEYRRNLKRFILPALGRLRVEEVTRADVAKFHHDLRHIPYQANRNIEIVSKMFNLAEMWGLRPDGSNPRRHIRKYVELKRERFLSAAELTRLSEVLGEMEAERIESAAAISAVRLLVLTGCRLNEIMKLRWEHVDFSAAVLRLPESKTGAKTVHLGRAAVACLATHGRNSLNPYVIPGTLPGKPLSDLQPFWRRVRNRAGLKDVRLHDLRHTYASVAVAAGQSLPMIGKLLGHTQVQTTARYAHLAGDPVHAAANDVSNAISTSFR
ncbi:tyrosine-type recombinase/integrase [Sphingomonas sp. 1P06PA]|uniref:tyrosine-type recombinase/integrase n=1 Tax=Sphingomonas sp. 1P06PA TaxID=554121 RepID=UPI0039A69591